MIKYPDFDIPFKIYIDASKMQGASLVSQDTQS